MSLEAIEERFDHDEPTRGKNGATWKRSWSGVLGRWSDAVDESFDRPTDDPCAVAKMEKFDGTPSGEAREDVIIKPLHGIWCRHSPGA